jgi:anti-anti-sigma factor
MKQQAYQIDRDRRVLVARPTRTECTGSDIAALIFELRERIDRGEADSVVIELSNVQHMDSCCLGRLLTLNQHARAAGGSIALARCQPNVAFLFQMTRLDKLLGIYESTESAVAELRERRTRPKITRARPDNDISPNRTGRYAPLLTALLCAHKRKHAPPRIPQDNSAARPPVSPA